MRRNEQILHVASRLFSERGFHAVSIDDIGEAAGISGPGLYRHFANKVDIFRGVCDLTLDRLAELAGPPAQVPEHELATLVRAQAQLSLRYPQLACVFEIERALPDDLRRHFRLRQRTHARRWVAAMRALAPARTEADITLAVYAAIGLLISVARMPREVLRRTDLEASLIATAYRVLALAPACHSAVTKEALALQ
ncbi:TetR/AcrR family transcriptional regulator [Bradyrhizobium sp. 2TAF24]|uniref:TetR/AcrR family transcriptional regulator n=1 Tax=Bradyrhizobium sp. 2TAF24 TaxID=3233011 RepID=UPI003F9358D4